ncbi:MAG: GHKL domain-containing protein [Clostridiales bacterium]|nr:GHKL domain-containing protein [Clostridiales bacterium]
MDWLDRIILFFCCIVEVFVLYDFFSNFFEIKVKKKYVTLICTGLLSIIYLINMLQNNLLNLVLGPIVLWIFITLLFDIKWRIRLVYFVIAYIVMISVEFLYIILSNTTITLLAKTGLILVSEYFWQLLLIKFLNYIVFILLKQMSSKTKHRMTNKLFLIYLCVPVSTLGVMFTIFYSGVDVGGNTVVKLLMTLFFGFMIAGNILLFYAFQKYTENLSENSKQQLELLYQKAEVERLTKIAEWNDNYNEIVHDASHYLKVIGQLAYERKNDEICKVVDKLNGKLHTEEAHEYCNHKMLNIILKEYSVKAQSVGVVFDAYVEPGSVLEGIQDVDLITMIGNLLDNAILAASKKQKDSSVIVRIFMEKEGRLCVIKIVNDFKKEEVKEIGGKLISTKKDAGIHGIGLKSVSRIAEQYGGYLEHYVIDEKFNAVVILAV